MSQEYFKMLYDTYFNDTVWSIYDHEHAFSIHIRIQQSLNEQGSLSKYIHSLKNDRA